MSEFNSKSTQNQHGNYELEPCPFCGEEEIYAEIQNEDKALRIYCSFCPAEMILSFGYFGLGNGQVVGFNEMECILQEMVDKWNTRTPKERGGEK